VIGLWAWLFPELRRAGDLHEIRSEELPPSGEAPASS